MVAVAAISFTSCSNNFTEEIVTGEKIQFNVSAVNEEVTRSAFGEPSEGKYPTLWSGDEGFALNINGADGKTTEDVTATFSGDKRAVNLSANIKFETAPETYTLYAIAPATAYVSVQPSGWQVTIPTSQTTGTLSCDPAAQILVGASETKTSASETFDMTFKHAVAYGKMSLINLDHNGATISSVAITSTKNIANRFYINQATREYSDNSGAKTITVNTTSAENIWFALAPVDVSNTELKIVVNTDKGTFTKTVNMPENRKFELGKISTFNVDMSGIELAGPVKYKLLKDASNLKVGDKVVIAAADYNFAISTTQNGNNRGQAAITKSADKKTISDPGADVEIFTVETGKKSETYAFKATKTAGYIYAASSSSNHMKTKATLDANGSWKVTVAANGVATITAQGTNTRNLLRYNTSSSVFSCYGSGQADVVIYHMEGGGDVELTPSITADNISGVAAEGVTDATATFTSENLTEAITVTCDGDVVTAASVAESTITYTVSKNTTEETREGWIKLAANGVEKTITVSQLAPISEPEGVTTVTLETFSAASADMDGVISYACSKGGGTADPFISGDYEIRLYQNSSGTGGGYITITAKTGYTISSVTIGSSTATSVAHTIGASNVKSATSSLAANAKHTVSDVNSSSISIYCMGITKNTRLNINYLSVSYKAAN